MKYLVFGIMASMLAFSVFAEEKCVDEMSALKSYLEADDQEIIPEGYQFSDHWGIKVLDEGKWWNPGCTVQVPYWTYDEVEELGADCFVPVKVRLNEKGEIKSLNIKKEEALCFS